MQGALLLQRRGLHRAAVRGARRKPATVPLGFKTFKVAPGRKKTIRVALTKRARRLVRKRGRLQAKVNITTSPLRGGKAITRSRRVVLGKKKPARRPKR